MMWRYLWSRNEVAVNVPRYQGGEDEDSVDLQIKSLMYMFERLKVYNFAPFIKISDSGKLSFDWLSKPDAPLHPDVIINDKLDSVYNIQSFKKILLDDPYRILIDYCKNKFRSYLILSDNPKEFPELPEFMAPDFHFTILKANSSDKDYIDVLVNKSDIYKEHNISQQVKIDIAREIIYAQRTCSNEKNFNKNDRAKIIKLYVQKLAFHIQVERIYKATLKSKEQVLRSTRVPLSNACRPRGFKTHRSVVNLQIAQPLKSTNRNTLRAKPSMSIMKLDNVYSESTQESDSSDTLISSGTSETGSDDSLDTLFPVVGMRSSKCFTEEEKSFTYEQSKLAVRIRVERERAHLKKSHA
ncbi:hypothetical protein KL921_001786 [Ogataea angusta]|uniref:Uncharacterized protein n=1 Tax=Pichia angusta TaxID=870730 RepID=A0AAN6I682_PICAN|nr:uncharacterized protein KL928_003020 [Ogataea angusta]KAG7812554.1 hypothetical protein KL921_001786 [Ogataea angusta]KAG7819152.1 hypothetical protein KL928_003020 [Ogataea angusta]KAG7830586.1 hypothetical protein KL920_002224 [Ogataea angusta]KAG7834282.1 hypothetical protein KL943_002666 [Ogataea angusta]